MKAYEIFAAILGILIIGFLCVTRRNAGAFAPGEEEEMMETEEPKDIAVFTDPVQTQISPVYDDLLADIPEEDVRV